MLTAARQIVLVVFLFFMGCSSAGGTHSTKALWKELFHQLVSEGSPKIWLKYILKFEEVFLQKMFLTRSLVPPVETLIHSINCVNQAANMYKKMWNLAGGRLILNLRTFNVSKRLKG